MLDRFSVTQEKIRIVCFGEVLWDCLPSGNMAGGAPTNVAYHANQLGIFAQTISKVGHDSLGKSLLEFLSRKEVDTTLVQIDQNMPTGTVNVQFDHKQNPNYEIVAPMVYLCKFLQNLPSKKCLEFAAMTGAFIATKKGGTPTFTEKQVLESIKN